VTVNHYPLLNLFWTMLYFFIWVLWIFLLIRILTDVFRSPDLNGFAKAGWTLLLIVLPFLGALAYIFIRGSDMHLRESHQAAANQDVLRQYLQHTAGGSATPSPADELTKLATLREQGVLSEAEFSAQKAKILA
jgi:hypothetical protein